MKCLYINLDSRTDRRAEAEAEFKRVGLTVERFPACTGDNRPLAFNKSVRGCMELAKGEALLLFEDDVVFEWREINPNLKDYLRYLPRELPKDWLSLHLGANIIGMSTTVWQMPTPYDHNAALLHNAWMTHAILYSAECVKFILDNFPYYTDEYEKEGLMIFDEWLRVNVFPLGRSYVMKPMIAYQRESFSDIWNCPANYEGAHKQGNEWLKKNL